MLVQKEPSRMLSVEKISDFRNKQTNHEIQIEQKGTSHLTQDILKATPQNQNNAYLSAIAFNQQNFTYFV